MQASDVILHTPSDLLLGKSPPSITLAQSISLPDLSQLPPWAVVAFGISLAIIVAMGWLGERAGRRGGSSTQGQATVAAVIVDPSALNAAAAAVDGLTAGIASLVVTLNAMNVTASRTAEELDAVREEMRIHREVSRRG